MSRAPLLGTQSTHGGRKRRPASKPFLSRASRIFSTIVPYTAAYDGIAVMLNSPDIRERDELTRNWRDHKLEELSFVGTVGALLASCLSSTSSWPDVLESGMVKPWYVRALYLSGLVFALFSVMIAGTQSMRLHRLSAHPEGLKKIRIGLGRERVGAGEKIPHTIQILAWEASQFFLVLSVGLLVTGVAVLVWVSADKPKENGWWDENAKLAVMFTSALGFAIVTLFVSQTALMDPDDEIEE